MNDLLPVDQCNHRYLSSKRQCQTCGVKFRKVWQEGYFGTWQPVLRILKNLRPNYNNEKFLIKDKNGKIIKKSENLIQLIDKTSWNNLKLVK